jgi:biopolymer transport protein ExbD
MAEISTSDKSRTRGGRKSTSVDMTPMVDLGFLLITFFMLTTTLLKPVTMQLSMPVKENDTSPIRKSDALTLILDKNNKIFYYQGLADDPSIKIQQTNFSINGIRKILFGYRGRIGDMFSVVIKSTDQAKYKNMVDLLDELTITNNKRYAIVNELTDNELNRIAFQAR